ncbi:MAG: hypothetical protein ACE5IK_00350 [Acidobacteriota bacterium]
MRGLRRFGWVALGAVLALPAAAAGQGEGFSLGGPIRWTASGDWEYYRSDADSGSVDNRFNSFRQKYALDTSGFLWDPRFNRFSLGLDLYRTDSDSDGDAIDTSTLGYRGTTTFFPGRPFPLTFYGRRSNTDSSGVSLAQSDRETAVWGAEWNLATQRIPKLRLVFDRGRFELLSPVALEERSKNGLVELDTRLGGSDLSFRYGLHRQKESVNGTDFRRRSLVLTDRTRFAGGANLNVTAHYTLSDATFSTREQDDLTASRVSARFDLPRRDRSRMGWSYDFQDNDGRFVDSTSHLLRTQAHVSLGRSWETDASLKVGAIDTESSAGPANHNLLGVEAGVHYRRDWARAHLATAYSIDYDRAGFNSGPDRRALGHRGEVGGSYDLNGDDEIFATVSYTRDDNDTTGVGFTFDEARVTVGWEGRFQGGWKMRASGFWRDTSRDTFDFGLQSSEEYGVEGSLSHPRGGFNLTLSTRDGVSDFLPDPASSSVFVQGTDLVSEADVGTFGAHWRLWRGLRLTAQARIEDRTFTTIGDEKVLSYRPEIDYVWGDWTFSAGLSHYERRNETAFTDDTLIIRVTRRFF